MTGIEFIDSNLGSLLSAAGGGGLAVALCKALITKTLRDLSYLTEKMNHTLLNLEAVNLKMSQIDKINEIIILHDRAIQRIEAKLEHEHQIRLYQNNSQRE